MASSAQQDPDPALAAETQVPTIYGLTVTLTALSTVVVALRFYTRLHILGNVGSDDATIGLAQVLSIAVAICTCFEARFSLGRHVWVVDPADTVLQLQVRLSSTIRREACTESAECEAWGSGAVLPPFLSPGN